MILWVVIDPDNSDTPLGGIWSTLEEAEEHCDGDYIILKVELGQDYSANPTFLLPQ